MAGAVQTTSTQVSGRRIENSEASNGKTINSPFLRLCLRPTNRSLSKMPPNATSSEFRGGSERASEQANELANQRAGRPLLWAIWGRLRDSSHPHVLFALRRHNILIPDGSKIQKSVEQFVCSVFGGRYSLRIDAKHDMTWKIGRGDETFCSLCSSPHVD